MFNRLQKSKKANEKTNNEVNNKINSINTGSEDNELIKSLKTVEDLRTLEGRIQASPANKKVQELKNEITSSNENEKISEREKQSLINIIDTMQDELQDIFDDDELLFDSDMFDEEFRRLRRCGYTLNDIKNIVRLLQKKLQEIKNSNKKNNKQKISQSLITNFLVPQELGNTILSSIYTKFLSADEEKDTTINTNYEEQIEMMAYLIENKNKLKQQEHEELMKKLRKIIVQQYLERKKVEIYEINIDENGNIIITTREGKKTVIGKEDWSVLGKEFINKFVTKDFGKKNLQKLQEIIMKQEQEKNQDKHEDKHKNKHKHESKHEDKREEKKKPKKRW